MHYEVTVWLSVQIHPVAQREIGLSGIYDTKGPSYMLQCQGYMKCDDKTCAVYASILTKYMYTIYSLQGQKGISNKCLPVQMIQTWLFLCLIPKR